MVFGQNLHQVIFHLDRILLLRQAQPVGNSFYMSVHHNARLIVNIPADYIGGFPPHTCQRGEILDGFRHFPAEFFNQILTAGDNIFCFIMVKTGGSDILLQLLQICPGKVLHARIFPEQVLSHHVNPGVRALGAENRGYQ